MKIKVLLIGLLMVFSTVFVFAQEKDKKLDVQAIVEKANIAAYYMGKDGKAKVHMVITDAQGRKRVRDFTIMRKDKEDGGDQYYYVYFYSPSDVRKMVFMVWKHVGKDDDRWLYLPALDLVKRIAASDKRSSFVGSDFLYEDVSGRGLEEDEHQLIDETDEYYIIKNIPKKPDTVEFSYYKMWIRKDNFIPVKAEYYDKQGKLYKVMEVLKIENIQGYPTVTKSVVRNLATGGKTELTFSDIKYDIGLRDRIFTERYLRRPPKEVRK